MLVMKKMLVFILSAVFLVSATMVTVNLVRAKREAEALEILADSLPERTDHVQENPSETSGTTQTSLQDAPTDSDEAEAPESHRYDDLYAQNSDLLGWIKIEGTVIDYPVMYTPKSPDKYLHKNFDGEYSSSGLPFMDAGCYVGCGNYLIYGHNMKNGSMFASILDYKDESFWQEHSVIYFDLVGELGTYQVIAAFYDKVHQSDETDAFRYYRCLDLTAEEDFNYYINNVKAMALYDTGIETAYGDSLLTLSTCSNHTTDGRFVVVAKKIS